MNLTTVERVKALLKTTASEEDVVLSSLIASASALAEVYMRRWVQASERTEYHDIVSTWQSQVLLRAWPVTAVASVHYDADRAFGAGSGLAATTDYLAPIGTPNRGVLVLRYPVTPGRGVLRVVYTGGMAGSTATLVSAYPDIASLIDDQVIYMYRHRVRPGSTGASSNRGSVSIPERSEPLLKHVLAGLRPHRRAVNAH